MSHFIRTLQTNFLQRDGEARREQTACEVSRTSTVSKVGSELAKEVELLDGILHVQDALKLRVEVAVMGSEKRGAPES